MTSPTAPDDIARMTFEEALAELESIVRRLEEGTGELDAAISSYERGAHLKAHCEAKLKEAQARVEKIVLNSDGNAAAAPADID